MPILHTYKGEFEVTGREVSNVRRALETFIESQEPPDKLCQGLCDMITEDSQANLHWYYWVSTSGLDWTKRCKEQDACYPIKHNHKYSTFQGPNLVARLSLAKHLLEKLNEQFMQD